MPNHPLRPPAPARLAGLASAAPAWPTFGGVARPVGTSPGRAVSVYVDAGLGEPALRNGRDLLADADRVARANEAIFGTPTEPVSVIIYAIGGATDGRGGADHAGCDFTTGGAIEVCAAFDQPDRISALFEAELSECSMGGRLCGVSTGESLSRWCAASVSGNALADFATAPAWVGQGAPDYVGATEPTDQDPVSIGCGTAFISWLLSQGQTLSTIAPALVAIGASGTWADVYASLTGDIADNAYPALIAALQALPRGVSSDDPFADSAARPGA